MDKCLRDKCGLTKPENYTYLRDTNGNCAKEVDDKTAYEEFAQALKLLQIDDLHHDMLMEILSGILSLGQVQFVQNENSAEDCELTADASEHIQRVAELWLVRPDALRKRLTTRTVVVANQTISKPLSLVDAEYNKDDITKTLYATLFDWVVIKVNTELYKPAKHHVRRSSYASIASAENRWIGILDVFGFECFDNNSFEQLCINFANERLQQFFNRDVVASEQEEYTIEAIFWTPVNVPDNQDCLDLVDGYPEGILSLLDAACGMPRGTDELFLQYVFSKHERHSRLAKEHNPNNKKFDVRASPIKKGPFLGFSIMHFAGKVIYNVDGFLQKNAGSINADTKELFLQSGSSLISKLFLIYESSAKGEFGRTKKLSVGRNFSAQLTNLMTALNATNPYFIRCINPNTVRKPNAFDPSHVLKQLRNGGLVEALRILKCGYPSRCTYDQMYGLYASQISSLPSSINKRDFCGAVLHAFDANINTYQLGLTKVFFKADSGTFLEDIMQKDSVTPKILTKIKDFLVRTRVIRLAGFMNVYARIQRRAVQIRLMMMWFKVAGNVQCFNKAFLRKLKAMRHRKAVAACQAFVRMHRQHTQLTVKSKAANVVQKVWRASFRRRQIARAIEARAMKKRDDSTRKALLKKRQEEEAAMQAKAAQAAKERQEKLDRLEALKKEMQTSKMVFPNKVDEVVKEGAVEVGTWMAAVLGLKDGSCVNIYEMLGRGDCLVDFLSKLSPAWVESYNYDPLEGNERGSKRAKQHIQFFIRTALSRFHLEKHDFFTLEDVQNMSEKKDTSSTKRVLNGLLNISWALMTTEQEDLAPNALELAPCLHVDFALGHFPHGQLTPRSLGFFGTLEEPEKDEWRYRDLACSSDDENITGNVNKLIEHVRQSSLSMTKNDMKSPIKSPVKKQAHNAGNQRGSLREGAGPLFSGVGSLDSVSAKKSQLESFFCMTVAALIRNLHEQGDHESISRDVSAKELFAKATANNIPWHMWNDWILLQIQGDGKAEGLLALSKRSSGGIGRAGGKKGAFDGSDEEEKKQQAKKKADEKKNGGKKEWEPPKGELAALFVFLSVFVFSSWFWCFVSILHPWWWLGARGLSFLSSLLQLTRLSMFAVFLASPLFAVGSNEECIIC